MKCIFCQHKTANSREHIFGAWTKKIAPSPARLGTYAENIVSTRDESGSFSRKRGPIGRAPTPTSATFRVVCNNCNNGWMNRIEQEMHDTYFGLFPTESHFINKTQVKAVERWLFLKSCLQEFAILRHQSWVEESKNFEGILRSEIETKKRDKWYQFMLTQTPNPPLRTYVFRIEDGYPPDFNFIDASEISHLGKPPIIYENQRLFICNFGRFLGIQTNILSAIDYLGELNQGNPYNLRAPRNTEDVALIEVNPNLIERRLIFRLQAIGPFFGKPN